MSPFPRPLLIAYLRLSLEDDSQGESHSIASQRAVINYFLAQNPALREIFEVLEVKDDGYSGTNFDRPGIRQVLEWVRQRRVGCIIVKDLSRFGRSYTEVGSYLETVFPFLGVRFISVNDGYDSAELDSATGGLSIVCQALIHDLYSRDISRKVKSSRCARIKRGDYFCNYAPFGYIKSSGDKHKLEPDPPAAEVVRRIFDMTLAGRGTKEIAGILNAEDIPTPLVYMRRKYQRKLNAARDNFWDSGAVLSVLNDARYTGAAISGTRPPLRPGGKKRRRTTREEWSIIPNSFAPIVPESDFWAAQRCISHPRRRAEQAPSTHLFPNMVRCAGCGRVMPRSNTKARYFHCRTNAFKPCPACVSGRLLEGDLIEAVLAGIRQQVCGAVEPDQIVQRERKSHGTRLASLERQLRGLNRKLNTLGLSRMELFEALDGGQLTPAQYKDARDEVERDICGTQSEIARLTAQADALRKGEPEHSPTLFSRPHGQIEALTQELVDSLVKSVQVYAPDRIEICWKHQDNYKKCVEP